jgi:hypothetical protein
MLDSNMLASNVTLINFKKVFESLNRVYFTTGKLKKILAGTKAFDVQTSKYVITSNVYWLKLKYNKDVSFYQYSSFLDLIVMREYIYEQRRGIT